MSIGTAFFTCAFGGILLGGQKIVPPNSTKANVISACLKKDLLKREPPIIV